jgi:hypothetical protein
VGEDLRAAVVAATRIGRDPQDRYDRYCQRGEQEHLGQGRHAITSLSRRVAPASEDAPAKGSASGAIPSSSPGEQAEDHLLSPR